MFTVMLAFRGMNRDKFEEREGKQRGGEEIKGGSSLGGLIEEDA